MVGVIGYMVDNLVFFMLSRYISSLVFLTFLVPFFSYELAMFNNYTLSYYWVWKDRRSKDVRFIKKLIYYNITTFVPFIFRMVIFVHLFRVFGIEGIIANMIAVLFGVIFNFFVCEKYIFKIKK
ncbi:MAG: GtrA family protein [Candidatus Jordarchaeum sp.]|uniref:GtrA family protein n=1 Tax=Candidatus Jordarchaeum sp. TaxID=2823881 RepID=UPI00404A9D6A